MPVKEGSVMANKNSSSSDIPAVPPTAPRAPRRRTSVAARPKNQNGDTRHTAGPDASPEVGPTHSEIAEAAYHKYLSRQGGGGSEFDDWLEAERDLRSRPASNPKSQ
jgi:hypothetical protein